MLRRWNLTVFSLIPSSVAISLLRRPRVTSARTSSSRSVSRSGPAGRRTASAPDGRRSRRPNSSMIRMAVAGLIAASPRPTPSSIDRSSAASRFLRRYPWAPALIASKRSSSSSDTVRMTIAIAGLGGLDARRRREPGAARHPDVHEHQVRLDLGGQRHRLVLAAGEPHDLVTPRPDERRDPVAEEGVVVGDEDPHRAASAGRGAGPVERHDQFHGRAPAGRARPADPGIDGGRPAAHRRHAVVRPVARSAVDVVRVEAAPVIGDRDEEAPIPGADRDRDAPRRGVLADVGQGLADRPEDLVADGGRDPRRSRARARDATETTSFDASANRSA